LIQEIQNYADLEHRYTSIMDKNDFSTPISKEDPIYMMFLKFLQQVIDDMKVLFLPYLSFLPKNITHIIIFNSCKLGPTFFITYIG
jgi:hypothetical protein